MIPGWWKGLMEVMNNDSIKRYPDSLVFVIGILHQDQHQRGRGREWPIGQVCIKLVNQ